MRKRSSPAERRISRMLYCDVGFEKLSLAFQLNQGLRPILGEMLRTMAWYWIQGLSPKISDAMRLHEVARLAGVVKPPEPQTGRTGETAPQLGPLQPGPPMQVSEAIATRRTNRAFLSDAVPLDIVKDILVRAARAPSGGNLQPWKVYLLVGDARDELVRRVAEKRKETPMGEAPEYHIYPPQLSEPYRTRRFRIGEAMYAALGIPREDKAARLRFFARNWEFFGAPVGMIFTIDRQMQQGQWADLGMFMQNVMLLARERGLHTCPQEAWAVWHSVIREYLAVPQNEMIFCGMGIGYADESAPVTALVSERAPLEEYVTIVGG